MSNPFGPATSAPTFGSTQPTSNPFGPPTNQPKPNPFGPINTNTSSGAPSGGLFGSTTANQQQGGGLFGSASQPPQQGSSIFGSIAPAQNQQQQGGGLFGNSTQNQASQGGLFGNTSSNTGGGNMFGSSAQNTQQGGGGLFGSSTQTNTQGSGLFGNQNYTQQQQGGSLLGGSSLFGGLGQNNQQQPTNQPNGSILGHSSQNKIWTEQDLAPRQKTVPEQIELVLSKWNPYSQISSFHTYLYNSVEPDTAAFYRPDTSDNEDKWEEALKNKPFPGAVPFVVKGFEQLGHRIISQEQHLKVLHGRLYEINNGLTDLLRRHDTEISTRAAECRRRHVALTQRCLRLATKTQVLRNRGYVMDAAEEELRQKLLILEKSVFDPQLNGRQEEIWARMVSVRERWRQLEYMFGEVGRNLLQQQGQVLDEETLKVAKKVLEDYNKQLTHLKEELEKLNQEFYESHVRKMVRDGTANKS